MQNTKRQIIEAMEQCTQTAECMDCVYEDYAACKTVLLRDALKVIKDQDKRIKKLEQSAK